MGDLLHLPAHTPTCFECINASFSGTSGTFCTLFVEWILSERLAAEDCLGYERETGVSHTV